MTDVAVPDSVVPNSVVPDRIVIRGASEHNLKNVSLELPRNQLVVITGLSGSGKSSLAYDIIYREGQRRFVESLSAYARQYLGRLDKPRVEHIEGLSPTISIDQKAISRNPRSTVGTITEIYDYLRLLYARLGTPHCPKCGDEIHSRSCDQIVDAAYQKWPNSEVLVTAPIILERKGEYRLELEELRQQGYTRVRIDGVVLRLDSPIELKRYHRHTIEVVFDRLRLDQERRSRFTEAVEKCLDLSAGLVGIVVADEWQLWSSRFACPRCNLSLAELEPRLFSFNSAQGACLACKGLGRQHTVALEKLIPNPALPVNAGAIGGADTEWDSEWGVDLEDELARWAERTGVDLNLPWRQISIANQTELLSGVVVTKRKRQSARRTTDEATPNGLLGKLAAAFAQTGDSRLARWLEPSVCDECEGGRLSASALAVQFRGRSIAKTAALTVSAAQREFAVLNFAPHEAPIGAPIAAEIQHRLEFMARVGLGYLTLDRAADSLSGGEAQRIRLASQLGSGLRGVLYVLDEPSIGLHPRDNAAMLETLRKLRDLGNSVIVVEHDRETIEAADFIVDMGPGAGAAGGEVVAAGDLAAVLAAPNSVTAQFLAGRRAIAVPSRRRTPTGAIRVRGAALNNLKQLDVEFPLGVLTVVTGVSGSGKSSLVEGVLLRAASQALGLATPAAGPHRAIEGLDRIDKVIAIDQSPIGRTPRSNPGTYTKVFDAIRDLYATLPLARARGYKKGRFSFNVKGGRCEHCLGAGVITVSMQFLADVDVVCEECEGRRYNSESLEVVYRGRTIAEVLDLPISAAAEFFVDLPSIARTLNVLNEIGLGYVKIGQPSTTLSGGEAQRIKLAHELRRPGTGQTLYVLDEPTTGLHFADVERLLNTLAALVEKGNTVVVIEHNVDVMKVADHIIDLGPEGGVGGGELIAVGTPESVARRPGATGAALAAALGHGTRTATPTAAARRPRVRRASRSTTPTGHAHRDGVATSQNFVITGAAEHNLKHVTVELPRNKLTVITGPSGSGKSTLAFDILFAEGQRRYVESLSTYARRFVGQLQRAKVERVEGIAPAIAIDQSHQSASPRSTVATATEIYDYLRVLFARIGIPHCPQCGVELCAMSPSSAARHLEENFGGQTVHLLASLYTPGAVQNVLENPSQLGVAAAELSRAGFARVVVNGVVHRLEEFERGVPETLTANATVQLLIDRVTPGKVARSRLAESVEEAYRRGRDRLEVTTPTGELLLSATALPSCPRGHFQQREALSPRHFSFNHHAGACPHCHGIGTSREPNESLLFARRDRAIFAGAMTHRIGKWMGRKRDRVYQLVKAAFAAHNYDLETPYGELERGARELLFNGSGEETFSVRYRGRARNAKHGVKWEGLRELLRRWHAHAYDSSWRAALEDLLTLGNCPFCEGGRLRPDLLRVRVGSYGIHEVCRLSVRAAATYFAELELPPRAAQIAEDVRRELANRLEFLLEVGLDYLTLDRVMETLSGGEAQRIRLATQIGNKLVGVLYVLDEPTIGLHQRDNERLLQSLLKLRDLGNSVVVVEHDEQAMQMADHIIDLGPGAGREGGQVMATGSIAAICRNPASPTGAFLTGRRGLRVPAARRAGDGGAIRILGAAANNLRDIDVAIPTGTLTVVTGVSGSGKSSLVIDLLARAAARAFGDNRAQVARHRALTGLDQFVDYRLIDQAPIGRTPASNPATYTGVFDGIRKLFARVPLARSRGYEPGRFSFNVAGGRCENCEGKGAHLVEMHFLSDVWMRCDVCKGRRYTRDTLEVRYGGHSIADVLDLEIASAADLFANHRGVAGMLNLLVEVGLGYVALGQAGNTLSGGEAQRLKLGAELGRSVAGKTLYLLDEPTTGLHFGDVEKLVMVLQRLVDRGDTVVVIEHNLELVKCADYLIDLGPEGGEGGGRIVATGTPEQVALNIESPTGRFLRDKLTPLPLARGSTAPARNPKRKARQVIEKSGA
ncbi:MAG: excinuclease ABC subunit UvrA [Planctomycetota bacterium]